MIRNHDIVVLSDDWHGLPTSTIHLVRRLTGENRVFWMNMLNRLPRLKWRDAVRTACVAGDWARQWFAPRPDAMNHAGPASVATPLMIPWFKPAVRRLNERLLAKTYRRLCREHAILDPIVLTTWPSAADFVRRVPAALKVYYCVDEWLDYPGLNPADWRAMENDLLASVDALVVTSRELESKGRGRLPVLYLPHGVDFEHFRGGAQRGPAVAALEWLPRPIVGFFGLLSPWVDLEAIAAMARACPQASFVLLGKAEVGLGPLSGLANVHWLGPVPYAELPRHARYFDVGLIPFVDSELTRAVNPLKLLEYYALGVPVLATRLPELEQIGGPIRFASTRDEFCRQLQAMLCDTSPSDAAAGPLLARRNTWEQRVEQLSEFLEDVKRIRHTPCADTMTAGTRSVPDTLR